MKILVIGLAKSGTTALAYYIGNSIEDCTVKIEPNGRKGIYNQKLHKRITRNNERLVTKCLFWQNDPEQKIKLRNVVNLYDKVVIIIRDPRDNMISSFLYRWNIGHNQPAELYHNALDLVKKKEQNPNSINLSVLFKRVINVRIFLKNRYLSLINSLQNELTGYHIIKYEDMVDGKFSKLETYLGIKVDTKKGVPSGLDRVKRSKSYGAWRDWFTPEDVKRFKEHIDPVMTELKYESDWTLNVKPTIDPKTSSKYMEKLYTGFYVKN